MSRNTKKTLMSLVLLFTFLLSVFTPVTNVMADEVKDEVEITETDKKEAATEEAVEVEEVETVEPATEETEKEEVTPEEPEAKVEEKKDSQPNAPPVEEKEAVEEEVTEEPAVEEATEEPAKEEPAKEEPAKEEPAKEEPAKEEATEELNQPMAVDGGQEDPGYYYTDDTYIALCAELGDYSTNNHTLLSRIWVQDGMFTYPSAPLTNLKEHLSTMFLVPQLSVILLGLPSMLMM